MAQRIEKVSIENFKGISKKDIELNGNHIYLVGPNGGGKTSFIDAAFGQVKCVKPLKDGEKKGKVDIIIDDYIIEFTFTEKNQKPRLNIFDKNGRPQKTPATLFKKLFGVQDFQINDFLNQPNSKKIDFIKEIIGIDWTEVDTKYQSLYDERTFLNRKIKECDGRLGAVELVNETEEINTINISQKIEKALGINSKVDRGVEFVKTSIIKKDEIRSKILELEKELISTQKSIDKSQDWLDNNPYQDVEPLRDEFARAVEINTKISASNSAKKEIEENKRNISKVEEIEKEMLEIQSLKKEELESSKMPVKGLSFDNDVLTLDGLPFESNQINEARKIIAALEIQYALKGDVSIARLEGSLLDKKSMDQVIEWADKNNIQLFVEKVDFEGEELKIEVIEK